MAGDEVTEEMNLVYIGMGILLSYLLGAVPNGLLIARSRGVDIRAVGSGNIGATNVFRSVGKGAGLLVFLLDALKGFVPAFCFPLLGAAGSATGILYGVAAILGHNWPVYLRFRGGKGVATSAGVLLGVAPAAAGLGLLGWLALFLSSRYVSVASMGAAAMVAAGGWVLYREEGPAVPVALTLLAVLVIWRHRSNLQRLREGTESRFSFTKRKES